MKLNLAALVLGLTAGPLVAQDCDGTSVDLVPLSELGSNLYRGFPGGLYPGGNARPITHEVAGMREALRVRPRNAAGAPDEDGRIGFLSIGLSSARNHFRAFEQLASTDEERDPRVIVVNGAQVGQPAQTIADASAPYWNHVAARVAEAGLTPAQVQVIWFLEANPNPTESFPEHALVLESQYKAIMSIVRERYPNARLCYFASRIYAGYATTQLEPFAYEQAFANRWSIEDQILADPNLNFDADRGPVVAPWIAWGPYMWADGLEQRSDGLTWECSDFADDGLHPSSGGANKVARALLDFVQRDCTTSSWYLAEPDPVRYGSPKPTSSGSEPRIGWKGTPRDSFSLTLVGGLPGALCVAFYGTEPGITALFSGTNYVAPPQQRSETIVLDAEGEGEFPIDATAMPQGSTRFFEILVRDPGHSDGFGVVHSDGLKVVYF